MKKIGIITGTRAEYGLLQPLMKRIKQDKELELQVFVTGMHLSPEFGLTYQEIEKDGFDSLEKIETLVSSDTTVGICKSMGLGIISFSEAFERQKPDMIVVLGDRYETFAAASAAMICRIPIAHLHGGELTEGLIDDAIRHTITKMSYLHFTSTEEYKKRVLQLGEQPDRVFNTGAIGIENIKNLTLLTKKELEEEIEFIFDKEVLLLTYHPVTLENQTSEKQFNNLLQVVEELKNVKVIFTKANSDTDGRIINKKIDEFVQNNSERSISFTSMGQKKYLSAMKYSKVIVGNSSSGIIEAPSFKIPTVNIGDRQKGRVKSISIIDCEADKESIKNAIKKALSNEFNSYIKEMINPYEGKKVVENIVCTIKITLLNKSIDIKKAFYNVE